MPKRIVVPRDQVCGTRQPKNLSPIAFPVTWLIYKPHRGGSGAGHDLKDRCGPARAATRPAYDSPYHALAPLYASDADNSSNLLLSRNGRRPCHRSGQGRRAAEPPRCRSARCGPCERLALGAHSRHPNPRQYTSKICLRGHPGPAYHSMIRGRHSLTGSRLLQGPSVYARFTAVCDIACVCAH